MKYRNLICALGLLSWTANAQIVVPKTSYQAMQRLWDNHIKPGQAAAWAAYAEALKPKPVESEGDEDLDASFTDDKGKETPKSFLIRSVPSAAASLFVQRELALHLYLHRDGNANVPTMPLPDADVALQKNQLLAHQQEANYELLLINLFRYDEGSSLEEKCRRITNAGLLATALKGQNLSPVANDTIQKLADSKSASYQNELTAKTVCLVNPAPNGRKNLSMVTKQLNEAMTASLRKQYESSIKPIDELRKNTFEALLNEVYKIDPHTNDLFQFINHIKRSEAGLNLVADDKFHLEELMVPIGNIDFDRIKGTAAAGFVPAAVAQVTKARQSLVDTLKILANKLSRIPDVVTGDHKTGITSACGSLETDMNALFPADPEATPGDADPFLLKFDSCLGALDEHIRSLQEPKLGLERLEKFADHLESLSREILNFTK